MRVYLAATTSRDKNLDKSKLKYCLETFFSGEDSCLQALNSVGVDNFLLDSGAFSYMNGQECTKEMLNSYLDRYIAFINKYNIKYFFELDVDTIYGIEYVEELRKRLENGTNRKCIPVWHKGRGVDYFKKMCECYKYVAIGGLVFHVKKQEYNLIKKMVDYAYKKGVKVHGLGFTKTSELNDYKFYSVDSASWVMSAVRGQQLQFFNGKRIIQRPLEKGNKKTDLYKLIAHNFSEWVKYQRYMDLKGW